MVVLYILLILVLSLLLWVIFVPVYLRINTALDLYEISQEGTMQVSLQPGATPPWNMRIFGFRVPFNESEKQPAKTAEKAPAKKKKAKFKRSPAAWKYMLKGAFRSITLKRFICTVDLDNVVLSAQLVPLLMLLNQWPVNISTNLNREYHLDLEIKAQLNKLIWTFIRFLTKK